MSSVFTSSDRAVALKMLLGSNSTDPEHHGRFQREARAASALNHPNICSVYDIGECGGQPYLVMEYLEGETLGERLRRGPLGQIEFLDVAYQIADALDAAHSNGILHRDIKPANVFMTVRHRVKVLDFGIAKIIERGSAAVATRSDLHVFETAFSTGPAPILGTVPYMSPEQVRGDRLDARSDLFSFGVLLYQAATGKLPFQGHTTWNRPWQSKQTASDFRSRRQGTG